MSPGSLKGGGLGKAASTGLSLWVELWSQAAAWLHPGCVCCTLSSHCWEFPVPSPFSSNGNPPTSELEGPLKIVQPPHFTAEERGLERGRGLCLATQPVGAELGLEPEAPEPARGFPGCRLSLPISLSCFILSHLIKDEGLEGQH